jgi:HAD superfamily hydrolase (TIGR01490 family)
MVAQKEAKGGRYSGISAFDLDHTLLSGNSSYLFGRYLFKRKILTFFDLAFIVKCNFLFHLGFLPIRALHHAAFERLFKGRLRCDVEQWACEFVDERLQEMLYPPAADALRASMEKGHLAAILSSSPDFLIEPIAAKLHVPIRHATRYSVDKDHRFCDIHSLIQGSDKAGLLEGLMRQHQIPLGDVFAYSDSHLDLPFLESAGHAVGVNPNSKLRAVCKRKKWMMI